MVIFEALALDVTNIILAVASSLIIYFAWKTNISRQILISRTMALRENDRRQFLDNLAQSPGINACSESELLNYSEDNGQIDGECNQEALAINELNRLESRTLLPVLEQSIELAVSTNQVKTENNASNVLKDNDITTKKSITNIVSTPEAPSMDIESNRKELSNLQDSDSLDTFHIQKCFTDTSRREEISQNSELSNRGQDNPTEGPSEFRVKLKYLNDNLRVVKGSPIETIDEFKKKNFIIELSEQKLVRLVFNGHVLDCDSKTLQACGLFDNCVVHCLIHKKPSAPVQQHEGRTITNNDEPIIRRRLLDANLFLNRNIDIPALVYMGIALVTIAIIFCWYCRVQYSYLFSWYSKTGLLLMTILFIMMIIVLIELEIV